jgi:hypothetical protein
MAKTKKILIIVTNVPAYAKVGYRTGLWLGEPPHFGDVAEPAGYQLEIASPAGGPLPLDPEGLSHEVLAELGTEQQYADRAFMGLLKDTKKLSDVTLDDYDREDLLSGVRSGIDGTPTFFINGRRHDGPWDLHSLTEAVMMAMTWGGQGHGHRHHWPLI